MFICQYCGSDEYDDIAPNNEGFWCADCDSFTYLDKNADRHRFTLILEKEQERNPKVTNLDIKFNKRLSPYRYAGGKSKLIDYLYTHLRKTKSKKLVSPYTGGGSFELAMLDSGVIEELHINDIDTGVYSLWWTIKHMPYELIERIRTIIPTHEDFFKAQEVIKNDYVGLNVIECAWVSLLVNRLAYSGIYKANPLGGKNGSQKALLSRWNPNNLIKRIEHIYQLSDRITITQEDALDLIEETYWQHEVTLFIDPPFVSKGKALYKYYYKEEDHINLAFLLQSLHSGFSGADIVVTYDYNEWIKNLYTIPEKKVVGRVYSI